MLNKFLIQFIINRSSRHFSQVHVLISQDVIFSEGVRIAREMGAQGLEVLGRTLYRHLLRRYCQHMVACKQPASISYCSCAWTCAHATQKLFERARAGARSARLFDRQPVLRALIGPDFTRLPRALDAVVNAYLGGASLYVPAPLLPRSVMEAVRMGFRFPVQGPRRTCVYPCAWPSASGCMSPARDTLVVQRCPPHAVQQPTVKRSERSACGNSRRGTAWMMACWACGT